MNREIRGYILKHRDKYTPEAIRQKLTEAGHDPAEIDETWATIEAQERSSRDWRDRLVLYVLALYGITLGLYICVFTTLANLSGGMGIYPWVFSAALLAAMAASLWLVRRNLAASMGLTGAISVSVLVPFALVVIISGLCLAWA